MWSTRTPPRTNRPEEISRDCVRAQSTARLLEQAKALPADERAEIADGLLATLPDDEVEAAWAAEIERRAREAHDGLSVSRPLDEHV